jgi:xanthine dehydrogenase accessory factor
MTDDHKAVYEALMAAQADGLPAALATVIHTQGSMPRHAGSKMLVRADGSIVGTVGGGAMEAGVIAESIAALGDGQTRLKTYTLNSIEDGDPGVCGGTAQIFIEPIGVGPRLLVIGGGHVGRALAELGKWMGFYVILTDDRADFANPDHVPGLDRYVAAPPEAVGDHIPIDRQTYIAAVTRGINIDLALIPALLKTEAGYIGLIGSRRRWALTEQALLEQGMTEAQLKRVHAPIGLELEAETPREIALSIMAEIVMLRRGGTGQPMSGYRRQPG